MEHANKAIMMAFGMLVAVMILATIVFVFTSLKALPTQDDELETIEQIKLFNQEYEVYDKKIMYGVDIISVLNKAKSNNEKYVQGKFLSGIGYNTDYIINIVVKFKTDLQENFEVTYLNATSNGVDEIQYTEGKGPKNIKVRDLPFKAPSNNYQDFIYIGDKWNDFDLKTQTIDTKIKSGEYQLLGGSIIKPSNGVVEYNNEMLNGDSVLKELITKSAEMSQTIRNTAGETFGYEKGWNRATWYPAIYEMKTKKFKCIGENTVYSSKTGRIIYMEFTEV